MACPLTDTNLFRAPPRNPCLDESVGRCSAQAYSSAPISSQAHRCVEQTCFTMGSCLLAPCDSLRPRPPLVALDASRRPCERARPTDALLCAFLSLEDYSLYYQHYEATQGVADCWEGMAKTLADRPDAFGSFRVWEQIGYVDDPARTSKLYNDAFFSVIQSAQAGAL